ncbi:hypothetical protein HY008_03135, partial [Candidatus Woesebacteria bacterium]|nr:hypothetical protein [Candidatus Woesebacteria bacterium]
GRISFADKTFYSLFVFSVILYFILALVVSYHKFKPKLLISWMLVPLVVGILMSLKTPVLGYWRFLFVLPTFVGIIVLGLLSLPGKMPLLNLSAIILIFIFSNLIFWVTPSFQREDWKNAAKLISDQDSITILNFPDVFAPLKFYAPQAYYFPSQEKLGLIRKDLDQTLPPLIANKEKVFVFDYLSDLTDPKRQIITWLKQAGLKQVETHNFNGVGFVYEFNTPPVVSPVEP